VEKCDRTAQDIDNVEKCDRTAQDIDNVEKCDRTAQDTDNVEKCDRTAQDTDHNLTRPMPHCMVDDHGYRHTLRTCNTYCFPTATMVT
jgi:hypothetical protein